MASTTSERESLQTSPTLLSRLRDMRDHAGWQHFHELYRTLLLAVARGSGLGEEDAQDVVQEAIVEAAAALPAFQYDRARGRFKGWLLTIVRRRIANCWRAKHYKHCGERLKREQGMDAQTMDAMSADDAGFDEMWDAEWRTHALRVAEEHVKREAKPVQYQAFKLHVVDGIGAGEVARRLGLKLMEVYWAKYRIRKMMKVAIAETLGL